MFHTIQVTETTNRDKAEKTAASLRKAGYDVSCISYAWSVYRVSTKPLTYSQAYGVYRQLQKSGYKPVML